MDDIDEALSGLVEIKDPPAKPPPPVYSLREQIVLGEERRSLGTSDPCPMCNMEMGDAQRARLRVGSMTWLTCSIGCAFLTFKRVVANPRAEASVIEAVNPPRSKFP
jgi:hypothetical protein